MTPATRYTLAQDNGWWWLVTPDGERLFSIGVNHLGALGRNNAAQRVAASFGCPTDQLWNRVTQHLHSLGCNTLGYDAPDALRQTLPYLADTTQHPATHCVGGSGFAYPDVFDPAEQQRIADAVQATCEAHRDRPNLIGYFWTDTPRWNLDIARRERATDWVTTLRRLGPDAPAKRAYIDFLRETYAKDADEFARTYRLNITSFDDLPAHDFAYLELTWPAVRRDDEAFLARIADTLYRVTADAFHRHDPGRLLFGERYKSHDHHDGVLLAAAKYIDVVSIQDGPEVGPMPGPGKHESAFDTDYYNRLHQLTGKPVLICDHNVSFKTESHPVTLWHACDTAEQAAQLNADYLHAAASTPHILGYGRCQYLSVFDPQRRLLKQGLLDEDGLPYPTSNVALTRATADALAHRQALATA
ncbi:MAG: hypothetical protein AAF797_05185 [Planctomycetota bacterium]